MIELENVSKAYSLHDYEFHALKGVDLKINDGEFVGILGSSGSGKSTLMHIIGLLDLPSEGKVNINGQDVSGLTDNELSSVRNKNIGFVFQQFNLINKLSVLENVLLPTIYAKEKTDDSQSYALELLKRFGILERKDFRPNKISGGQQQRVAIARALIMKPSIVLADEPTGNLDSKTGEEILRLLEELNKDLKVTVVIVTHDEKVARRTKRQIFVRDGQIVKKL